MFRKCPPEGFEAWLSSEPGPAENIGSYQGWAHSQGKPTGAMEWQAFWQWQSGIINSGKLVAVEVSDAEAFPKPEAFARIRRATYIKFEGRGIDYVLEGATIREITVLQGTLVLRGCKVGTLNLRGATADVFINDSWIGLLSIAKASFRTFEMRGGGILNIDCPAPGELAILSPFALDRRVQLPDRRSDRFKTAQPLRNLRIQLTELGNVSSAGVAWRAELRFVRRDLPWWSPEKWLSHIYAALSDYGTSIGRPLGWFFFPTLAAAALLYWFDGVLPTPADQAKGWMAELQASAWRDRLWRAVNYAFGAVFNPLGVFGVRSSLMVAHEWLFWLVHVLALTSTAGLAFLVFAVRRRFRLEQ